VMIGSAVRPAEADAHQRRDLRRLGLFVLPFVATAVLVVLKIAGVFGLSADTPFAGR
jgi:hypothetical protein